MGRPLERVAAWMGALGRVGSGAEKVLFSDLDAGQTGVCFCEREPAS